MLLFVFEVQIGSHVGELGCIGDVGSVHREGRSEGKIGAGAPEGESLDMEGPGHLGYSAPEHPAFCPGVKSSYLRNGAGARCQENGRLEVREDWGSDFKGNGGQNNAKERRQEREDPGKKVFGGSDLVETLQLLGQEVSELFLSISSLICKNVTEFFILKNSKYNR